MPTKCEKIVKTFYEALEEGKILGRKCTSCGHIEYPPYLACNTCGGLDTEWVELPHKAMLNQVIVPGMAFSDPVFAEKVGPYCLGAVQIENCDEVNTCIIGCTPECVPELRGKLPVPVRPVFIQEDGYKMVFWQLDESV